MSQAFVDSEVNFTLGVLSWQEEYWNFECKYLNERLSPIIFPYFQSMQFTFAFPFLPMRDVVPGDGICADIAPTVLGFRFLGSLFLSHLLTCFLAHLLPRPHERSDLSAFIHFYPSFQAQLEHFSESPFPGREKQRSGESGWGTVRASTCRMLGWRGTFRKEGFCSVVD